MLLCVVYVTYLLVDRVRTLCLLFACLLMFAPSLSCAIPVPAVSAERSSFKSLFPRTPASLTPGLCRYCWGHPCPPANQTRLRLPYLLFTIRSAGVRPLLVSVARGSPLPPMYHHGLVVGCWVFSNLHPGLASPRGESEAYLGVRYRFDKKPVLSRVPCYAPTINFPYSPSTRRTFTIAGSGA